jgi:hypothetical protein
MQWQTHFIMGVSLSTVLSLEKEVSDSVPRLEDSMARSPQSMEYFLWNQFHSLTEIG